MATCNQIAAGRYSADAATVWDVGREPLAGEPVNINYNLTLDKATAVLGTVTRTAGTLNFNGYTLTCAVFTRSGSTAKGTSGGGSLVITGGSATSFSIADASDTWGFTGSISFTYVGASDRTYNFGTSRTIPNNITVSAGGAGKCYLQCTTSLRTTGTVTINGAKNVQLTSGATYITDTPWVLNTASGSAITATASVAGSPAILCCLQGGTLQYDWLVLQDWQVSELVLNPGFETAGAGGADVFASWTEYAGSGVIAQDTGVYHAGAASAKLTRGATVDTDIHNAALGCVVPGVSYAHSFWTKGDGANAGRWKVYDSTNSADIIAAAATGVTGDWAKVSGTFTVPANCIKAIYYFFPPNVNAAYAYFDDVSVKLATPDNWYAGANSTIGTGCIGWNAGTAVTFVYTQLEKLNRGIGRGLLAGIR